MDPFCFQKTIKIALRRRLEPSWARLGRILARLGASGAHLGASWGYLGSIFWPSCAIGDRSEAKPCDFNKTPLKPMKFNGFSKVAGAMLAPSWFKRLSWKLYWPSWRPSWSHFSAKSRLKSVLGASWDVLVASWTRLGASWTPKGGQHGPPPLPPTLTWR